MIALDDCRALVEPMHRYVSQEATEEEKARVVRHLQTCRRCQGSVQRLREVRGLLQGALAGDAASADSATTHSRLREVSTGPRVAVPAESGELEAPVEAAGGLLDRWAARFGAAPWWFVSGAFHALLILLLFLIGLVVLEFRQKDTVLVTSLAKLPEKEPEKEPPARDIFRNPTPLETQTLDPQPEVVLHQEVEVAEHNETADELDAQEAFGDEGISDIPLGGSGFSGAIGIGGGGAGAFGRPTGAGGRLRRAIAGGGGQATESAVDKALAWLARNQEPDGSWKIAKHGGTMPEPHIGEVAVTGLGLLAFLGAGHTERVGKYAEVVRKAQDWLISQQKANGALGVNDSWNGQVNGSGYTNAIAGLALAESYAMSRNPRVKEAAQKSLDYSLTVQWNDKHGGWRYGLPSQGHGPNLRGADISVTGWHVMQLKSAKVAGLNLDLPKYYGRVSEFLDALTTKDAAKGDYASHRYGYDKAHTQPSQANTAIGLVCRLFMGADPHELSGGADFVLGELPRWDEKNGPVSAPKGACPHYYWYYATLALFQIGGEHWAQWNKALKDLLLQHQRKDGAFDGSWDLLGKDGVPAGRAYTTAMGALCLEVYYRYLPLYR